MEVRTYVGQNSWLFAHQVQSHLCKNTTKDILLRQLSIIGLSITWGTSVPILNIAQGTFCFNMAHSPEGQKDADTKQAQLVSLTIHCCSVTHHTGKNIHCFKD